MKLVNPICLKVIQLTLWILVLAGPAHAHQADMATGHNNRTTEKAVAGQSRLFTWPSATVPGTLKVLVDSAIVPGENVEVAEVYFPPGWVGESHVHELEILYVIEGDLSHSQHGKTRTLSAGMIAIAKAPDAVIHSSKQGAKVLVIWPKGGEVSALAEVLDEVKAH